MRPTHGQALFGQARQGLPGFPGEGDRQRLRSVGIKNRIIAPAIRDLRPRQRVKRLGQGVVRTSVRMSADEKKSAALVNIVDQVLRVLLCERPSATVNQHHGRVLAKLSPIRKVQEDVCLPSSQPPVHEIKGRRIGQFLERLLDAIVGIVNAPVASDQHLALARPARPRLLHRRPSRGFELAGLELRSPRVRALHGRLGARHILQRAKIIGHPTLFACKVKSVRKRQFDG